MRVCVCVCVCRPLPSSIPELRFKYKALIFLANILCIHVHKSDEIYASPTLCTHAERRKKKTRPKWPWLAFDFFYAAEPLSRGGHVLTICSYQRHHLKSSPFVCKRNTLWRVGKAQSFRIEITCITLFEFASARLRLVCRQRLYKYRVWYCDKTLVAAHVSMCLRTSSRGIASWGCWTTSLFFLRITDERKVRKRVPRPRLLCGLGVAWGN